MVGETCDWCRERQGTHIYPDGDLFARHDNCDCLLVVSGYASRNGIVNNYKKVVNTPEREAHLAPTLERLRNYDETTAKFADVLEGQNRAELGKIGGDVAKTYGMKPDSRLILSRNYVLHMDNSGHFSGTGFGKNGHDSDHPLSNYQISNIPVIVETANTVIDRGLSPRGGLQRYEIIDKDKQAVIVEIAENKQWTNVVTSMTLSNSQYRRALNGELGRVL